MEAEKHSNCQLKSGRFGPSNGTLSPSIELKNRVLVAIQQKKQQSCP